MEAKTIKSGLPSLQEFELIFTHIDYDGMDKKLLAKALSIYGISVDDIIGFCTDGDDVEMLKDVVETEEKEDNLDTNLFKKTKVHFVDVCERAKQLGFEHKEFGELYRKSEKRNQNTDLKIKYALRKCSTKQSAIDWFMSEGEVKNEKKLADIKTDTTDVVQPLNVETPPPRASPMPSTSAFSASSTPSPVPPQTFASNRVSPHPTGVAQPANSRLSPRM